MVLIQSFGNNRTERLFNDSVVKAFEGFAARAKRKLEAVHAAARLEDLRVPPSNRLEKLRGARNGFHSIRINDQWRVVFRWAGQDAYEVSIVDYH
jgi:proteic killer suppression protein